MPLHLAPSPCLRGLTAAAGGALSQQCFKEQEFKDLFHEYLDEMSDPKNREEMDTYIRQLEGEGNVPEGMSIPEEGLCAKGWMKSTGTKDGKGSKYFLNVTHTPGVDKATSKTATDPKTGKKGSQWQIPFVISPQPKLVEVDPHSRAAAGSLCPRLAPALVCVVASSGGVVWCLPVDPVRVMPTGPRGHQVPLLGYLREQRDLQVARRPLQAFL